VAIFFLKAETFKIKITSETHKLVQWTLSNSVILGHTHCSHLSPYYSHAAVSIMSCSQYWHTVGTDGSSSWYSFHKKKNL